MVLAKDRDLRIDRLRIHGTKGFLTSGAEYNQAGPMSYCVSAGGEERTVTVDAPQNYSLEIEQFSRCIAENEAQHVSNAFSLKIASVTDRILASIGY